MLQRSQKGGNRTAQHVSTLLHFFGELGSWIGLKLTAVCCRNGNEESCLSSQQRKKSEELF